jgi:hypothetical protein
LILLAITTFSLLLEVGEEFRGHFTLAGHATYRDLNIF